MDSYLCLFLSFIKERILSLSILLVVIRHKEKNSIANIKPFIKKDMNTCLIVKSRYLFIIKYIIEPMIT